MSSGVMRCTKDYSKFEPMPENRNVKSNRKKFILESMKLHGYIPAYPIHCVLNGLGKLRIKDGHYRFQCAQDLGLKVWYVVWDDNATLSELVRTWVPWNLPDFADAYVNAGIKPYIDLREYVEKTGIPSSVSINMFSGVRIGDKTHSAGTRQKPLADFKAGKFKIIDTKIANMVGELVILCKMLNVDFATTGSFASAVSRIVSSSGFDMSRMKMKLKSHHHRMKKQATIDDYILSLEKIYNTHVSNDEIVPLAINSKKI
jgi:hypothetical protein